MADMATHPRIEEHPDLVEIEAVHGTLNARGAARRDITAVLTGGRLRRADRPPVRSACRHRPADAALPLSFVPSWHAAGVPDTAPDDADGRTARFPHGSAVAVNHPLG